ncbi:MAG: glycosyltransferase family 4 protein [Chloroflexi bacterium]|nr:glycosyltransferase family 4 protein [Chloroflexota bacterium]
MTIILDARTATDHFPGIGRYVVNLAHALQAVAPDLDLTLLCDPNARSSRLALPPNLPITNLSISPFTIQQQWRVPQQLRELKATLYHSPYYLMPYRPGVPTVLTAYDVIPLVYPQYYTTPQRLIFRFAHTLALTTARVTLAISAATKTDLIRRLGARPDRIRVTPLAADPRFTPQPTTALQAVRDKYHLPERFILYVGSNKPHKNLMRLVAAFTKSAVGNQRSAIDLIIAGSWDARYPEAKQAAKENDRIRFLGPISDADLPALYSSALAFAFVSEYEGFGLPPLEAMACGTPVIASNTSSLPEVVGDAGLLVDPHDLGAIAAALERVVDDEVLRLNLKQRSLARAAQFSWAQTARLTLDAYHEIMD